MGLRDTTYQILFVILFSAACFGVQLSEGSRPWGTSYLARVAGLGPLLITLTEIKRIRDMEVKCC